MGRKKNKTARAANGALKPSAVVVEWEKYMGQGELEDWQRLMGDLGFDEQFPSKTKCRQVSNRTTSLLVLGARVIMLTTVSLRRSRVSG